MVEVTSAKIAKYFEDGKISYAEAVALVVDARSYVAGTRDAYQGFLTSYAAEAQHAWTGGETALAGTADALAVRLVLAQRLAAVGFDTETAKAQGDAIGALWNDYLSAGSEAQKRAWYDTHGLAVGLRAPPAAPAPAPPPPSPGARSVASAATVELTGSIEGQMSIRTAFDGGITGEKARTLVYNARLFVKQPMATKKADIQDALTKYLSAHGFPTASATELGQLVEAAWRAFNEGGTKTFVDTSAVKLSTLRSPGAAGTGANRWVAKPATVALKGSEQGQNVIGGIFKSGKISGPQTKTLVLYARSFARLPDATSESAKIVPALTAYLEVHGFGHDAAEDVATLVDAAWHASNEKGQPVEVDVSAIRFGAAGGASVDDLNERYQQLDARLARLKDRVKTITPIAPVAAAQSKSTELQAAITGASGGLGADALATHAEVTAAAATLLDSVERALTGLETYGNFLATAPEPNRKGYLAAATAVYAAYVAAVAQTFDTTAGALALATAEAKAKNLPYALLDVDLTQLESRKSSDPALQESRQAIAQWAKQTRAEIATLEELSSSSKPKVHVDAQAELVSLSLKAMGQWETTLRAYEAKKDALEGFDALVSGYKDMQKAAAARNVSDLRRRVARNTSDKKHEAFYASLSDSVREPRVIADMGRSFVAAARRSTPSPPVSGKAPGAAASGKRPGAHPPGAGTGTVENLISTGAGVSNGGPDPDPVTTAFRATPDDPVPEGVPDYRGLRDHQEGDADVVEGDRLGHHIELRAEGSHGTITVTGSGAPVVVTMETVGSDRYYLRSIDISHYDEGAFKALRTNARGKVTGSAMPIFDWHLLVMESLSKDGYKLDQIKALLKTAFGPETRGRGDPRMRAALQTLAYLGTLLAHLPGPGGKPAFTTDEAVALMTVAVKHAPYGKRGDEIAYYHAIAWSVRQKLGTLKKPIPAGIAVLRGLLDRTDVARELALEVYLRDPSVGGKGAAELADHWVRDTDWTGMGNQLVESFQRNPSSPKAYAAVHDWYDQSILQLETARQRFAALAAGRGDKAVALLAKMIEQLTARRDGADPATIAQIDLDAMKQADAIWAPGARNPQEVEDVATTSDNLTALLKKLDKVAVPAADHQKAIDRAVAMAAKDAAQVYLVVDRGFDDKGVHQGYVVTVMPATLEDRRVVEIDSLKPQTVEKDAKVTYEKAAYKVADVANGKALLTRDQDLYGLLTQAVTSGEGAMVEIVMGALALALAKKVWPKDAGDFPSGETKDGVFVFHKAMVDAAFGKGTDKPLGWEERDALLIHMYEKIKGPVARRYQTAIDKFSGWKDDPVSLAKDLVQIGDQLGYDKTWLELRHLFGYDWTVTQDSALPVLSLVMQAVHADTKDERERLTRQMPSESAFKSLEERIDRQISALREAKREVDTPKMIPATYDDIGNVIVPEYQDTSQLFSIVESMPAMREELFRLLGLTFDPSKELTKDTFCKNAAEKAYRDAFLDHQWDEKVHSLVTGGLILVGTIVLTAVTGGIAGPVAAMWLGVGIAAIQAGVDIHESDKREERTLANVQAGVDTPDAYEAAQRDATWARVMGAVNIALGPILASVNASGATPWFRSLLLDSGIGMATSAIDGRTWNAGTGEGLKSVVIAGVFGAAGSLGGRAAHAVIEGRHSPGMRPAPETGERIRLEIEKGSNEVRVVNEEGKVLRTGKVLRRGVDEVGRPTNELVLEDTRPGHKNEVFTLAVGRSGPMAEPGTGPSEAALPSWLVPSKQHPVLGNHPVVAAPPATAIEHFSYAEVGETVRVSNAPGIAAGDYKVLTTDRSVLQIEVLKPVNLKGGSIVEAGGVEYIVTRGNAGMTDGVGLNEMAVVDVRIVPELRGKKNGEVVKIGSKSWRLRFKAGLPEGHARIVAESAVDPATVARRSGGTMTQKVGAATTTLRVEAGRVVEPESRFVGGVFVKRIGTQAPMSQAQFEAMLHPGGAPRGAGQTWVNVEEPTLKVELGGQVFEYDAQYIQPGRAIRDVGGTVWDITAVDMTGGTYKIQERGNPANTVENRLYAGAWEVVGYDPATGQVSLRRSEVRVEQTHYVERTLAGFAPVLVDEAGAGKVVTDAAGRRWTISNVDPAAHTVTLTDGPDTQTVAFTDANRQQLRHGDFAGVIDASALASGQVIVDKLGRPWEVFEVNRGGQPKVSLRRTEYRTEPVERIQRYNPRGAKYRVDLEPKTPAMLTGNRLSRGWAAFWRAYANEVGVPKVGAKAVTQKETVTKLTRKMPMSHNPAAPPDALGARGGLDVEVREYTFEVTPPGTAPHKIKVFIPVDDVSIPEDSGRKLKAETTTHDKMLARVKQMLAEMPTVAVGTFDEIRVNPVENAQDEYWKKLNPHAAPSMMTAGTRIIDVYPEGMRTTIKEANSVFLQTAWHEMGHTWAEKTLGHTIPDHLWRRAVEADGWQNLPSLYAGNNLAEDFAEAVRLYVVSDGGRGRVFDMQSQQWVDGATLTQRYKNRFRALDTYFGRNQTELAALHNEFMETARRIAVGLAPVVARGLYLVKEWLDEDKKAAAAPQVVGADEKKGASPLPARAVPAPAHP